jgi:hypothetical protein
MCCGFAQHADAVCVCRVSAQSVQECSTCGTRFKSGRAAGDGGTKALPQ